MRRGWVTTLSVDLFGAVKKKTVVRSAVNTELSPRRECSRLVHALTTTSGPCDCGTRWDYFGSNAQTWVPSPALLRHRHHRRLTLHHCHLAPTRGQVRRQRPCHRAEQRRTLRQPNLADSAPPAPCRWRLGQLQMMPLSRRRRWRSVLLRWPQEPLARRSGPATSQHPEVDVECSEGCIMKPITLSGGFSYQTKTTGAYKYSVATGPLRMGRPTKSEHTS